MSHYKPYPVYRDSGVEWIGQVPEHWTQCALKHVLYEINSGGTPDTSNPEFWDTGDDRVPWVAISDMSSTEVITNTQKSITAKGIENKRLRVFPKGTLLFSMYASLGHMAELGLSATINQAILALIPNTQIDQQYLKRWLQFLQPHLIVAANNATQDNLNAEKIGSLPCFKLNLSEQKLIAAYIDRETARIDALIAKKTRFIELLKEKRHALITHAVTKGLDPDVPMKDTGVEWISEVPEHWRVSSVKWEFDIQLGKMLQPEPKDRSDVAIPYHKAVSVQWEQVSDTPPEMMWVSPSEIETYRIRNGDLLICEGGDVGRAALFEGDDSTPIIIQNSIHRVRPKNGNENKLLLRIMQTVKESGWFDVLCSKATIVHFTAEKLGNLAYPVASLEEQKAIVSVLDRETARIDTLIVKTQRSIDLLKERRAAFITAAVTGQIDLRESTCMTSPIEKNTSKTMSSPNSLNRAGRSVTQPNTIPNAPYTPMT